MRHAHGALHTGPSGHRRPGVFSPLCSGDGRHRAGIRARPRGESGEGGAARASLSLHVSRVTPSLSTPSAEQPGRRERRGAALMGGSPPGRSLRRRTADSPARDKNFELRTSQMDIAPPGQSNSPLEGQSSKVYCQQEYKNNVHTHVLPSKQANCVPVLACLCLLTSSRFSPVRMRSIRNSASLERPKGAYPRLISNFGSTIAHKIPLCELLDEPLTSKLRHAPTPPSLLPADLEPWGGQKRWSGSPAIVDEVTAYLRSRDPDDDSAMTEEYRQRPSMWLSSPMHVDLAEGHYLSPRLRKHRSRAAASALPSDDNAAWLQFYGAAVARARAGGPSPRQASQTGSAVAVEDVVEDNVRSGRLALSQLQAAAGANRAFFLQKQVRRPVFDHVRAVRACSAHARLMPGLALEP
jgi:hypothetical protein